MNDEILNQTPAPVEPAETTPAAPAPEQDVYLADSPGPEVTFLRRLVSRVNKFLNDPVSEMTGTPRLVAELLRNSGMPILLSRSSYDEMRQWQEANDRLQRAVETHTDVQADIEFEKQHGALVETISDPGHTTSHILSREEWRSKFRAICHGAYAARRKLYRDHIWTAREFANLAAIKLRDHAEALEAEEKNRFARYGLDYAKFGSPLVAAVRKAAKDVLNRVAADEGESGPDLILPWLIQ